MTTDADSISTTAASSSRQNKITKVTSFAPTHILLTRHQYTAVQLAFDRFNNSLIDGMNNSINLHNCMTAFMHIAKCTFYEQTSRRPRKLGCFATNETQIIKQPDNTLWFPIFWLDQLNDVILRMVSDYKARGNMRMEWGYCFPTSRLILLLEQHAISIKVALDAGM